MKNIEKINLTQVTKIILVPKEVNDRIVYKEYKKSFWEGEILEGFHYDSYDNEFIPPEEYDNYNIELKIAFTKDKVRIRLSDGTYIDEYYDTYNECKSRFDTLTNLHTFIKINK